jgi:hypothetical protein
LRRVSCNTDSQSKRFNTLFSTSPTKACDLLSRPGQRLLTLGCAPDLCYQVEHSIEKAMQQMIAKIAFVDLFVQYYAYKLFIIEIIMLVIGDIHVN